jgi:5'-hydroxyaverantin dehydrogenase
MDQIKATPPSLEVDPTIPSTRTLDVNLKGTYYTATLALHYFRIPSTSPTMGSLTLISSLAGYLDDDHSPQYTTSKFGTRGLFRALRRRTISEFNTRINLIAPWGIITPMTQPILQVMKSMGIAEGKGMTFAKKKTCAQAVGSCVIDEGIHGRAVAIMPEGAFDIGDDVQGGYGGDELRILMGWRRDAGDFLTG